MQLLQTSFIASSSNPNPHSLSSSNAISPLTLLPRLSSLSLTFGRPPPSTTIRMGGGPRTYPGGVSKWQWKRMQAKKAKQLLKARLSRERQIYEMRKRAELKAAVSELERPWEVVQKAAPRTSSLFSVSADEQLKVLADRFQKPGGFDLWSENDGPQLFETPEGLPSARFFPKGVVHSIKPYGRVDEGSNEVGSRNSRSGRNYRGSSRTRRLTSKISDSERSMTSFDDNNRRDNQRQSKSSSSTGSRVDGIGRNNTKLMESDGEDSGSSSSKLDQRWGKNRSGDDSRAERSGKRFHSVGKNGRNLIESRQAGGRLEGRKMSSKRRSDSSKWSSGRKKDVYDMSLQHDGSYGFSAGNQDVKSGS